MLGVLHPDEPLGLRLNRLGLRHSMRWELTPPRSRPAILERSAHCRLTRPASPNAARCTARLGDIARGRGNRFQGGSVLACLRDRLFVCLVSGIRSIFRNQRNRDDPLAIAGLENANPASAAGAE